MEELELTEKDKVKLQEAIESNVAHGKKQLLNFNLYILIGIITSIVIVYLKNGILTVRMFLGHIFIGIFMSMVFYLIFYLSRGTINKLKIGLEKGKKMVGKAEVKSINAFNGNVTLKNGIKLNKINFFPEKIRKGDIINYTVSFSQTYVFKCAKD